MNELLYEVWDQETGNCIGAYKDEAAALDAVHDIVRCYELQEALSLVLLVASEDGSVARVSEGMELVTLAERASSSATALQHR